MSVCELMRAAVGRLLPPYGGRRLPPLNDTYKLALARLQRPDELSSTAYLNRLHGLDWTGCKPDIKEFAQALTKRLAEYSVPFYVHGAYRSPAAQEALLREGVTRAGPGRSPHNHGFAVDVVHWGYHWDLTRKEWDLIGEIGKDLAKSRNQKIVWGGDFASIYDPAHWEIANWRELI